MIQKINNDQFGQFLVQLRKEKNMTQKQLAEKLYLSDKAISKWEWGLSLPDISLLIPLGEILDVTTTELLSGHRIDTTTPLSVEEVEALMTQTIILSKAAKEQRNKTKQGNRLLFFSCALLFFFELLLFITLGYSLQSLYENLALVSFLMFVFGSYFTFFAKETLPTYYDENHINSYHHGAFEMHIPGIHFNNSNWQPICKAAHRSIMSIWVCFPLLYWILSSFSPLLWEQGKVYFTLGAVFSMFIPIYIAGKKYA